MPELPTPVEPAPGVPVPAVPPPGLVRLGMPLPGTVERGLDMISVCCWAIAAVAVVPSANPRTSAKVLAIAIILAAISRWANFARADRLLPVAKKWLGWPARACPSRSRVVSRA